MARNGELQANTAGQLEVRANNISCLRGGRRVLRNITFSVNSGQCLEISGPNGSGKSTLLRTLAGIGKLAGGSVRVPRDDLGYLGHQDGLKGDLTVAENIRFWTDVHGRRFHEEFVQQFDLSSMLDRQVRHLSSGQRKRMALVSLFSCAPGVWLLDEPLTALDSTWTVRVIDTIAHHCAKGGIAVVTVLSRSMPEIANHLDISGGSADMQDNGVPP